ncbi:carbohydrate kinase [Pelagibius litoralis]|uniref:Carbohydrate kinase n=1 Tax=Pelagibius litoralis TaxID=374515 RepID=A0A967K967_9PROT|nr:FGGY-family carbohydrate kinase [Pelagibius litoralis]NIA69687.1 carbohydrate kinase [Pelagibius litoralis]
MTDSFILGIDSGNTVTKAAVFSEAGSLISLGDCEVVRIKPRPRFVERDMNVHWQMTCQAIRQAVAQAGIDPSQIAAVTATGHGDGLYLVDEDGAPLGNGIVSLDSRSAPVIERWEAEGVHDEALKITGQMPYAPAPSALLRWIKENEPERYGRIRWVLSCKDWLRYKLTGEIATDWTEASTAFVDPDTQDYSAAALRLFGLEEMERALPEAHDPCAVMGEITPEAAEATGLKVGTPVAAGLHDVTASAIGSGVAEQGVVSILAGTFSVNEIISGEPKPSPEWYCRNSFRRGEWMNMTLSPASSANIDWFVKQCCRDAIRLAEERGGSAYDYLEEELSEAFAGDSRSVYHPFLYGSPHGNDSSAAFLGLQGWQHRGHMMRALLEGVVFNHRHHVDALRSGFHIKGARLTGGSSRSPRICQLFSDGLGLDLETVDVDEAGALGAALCGAVAVGLYGDLGEAARRTVSVSSTFSPRPQVHRTLDDGYQRYKSTIHQLRSEWRGLRGE